MYQCKKKLYNISQNSHTTINNDIKKCLEKLSELSLRLTDRAGGVITKGRKPTIVSVTKSVKEILSRQYMKDIISVDYTERNNIPLIDFKVDGQAFCQLWHSCDVVRRRAEGLPA